MGAKALKEAQGFLWFALRDQHSCQGERTGFVFIARYRVVRANPGFSPACHRLYLSLREEASDLGGLGQSQ
jgi:hypothetical protein